QIRDLGERDRDIFGLPTLNERARFRADEEAAVVISRSLLDPKWPQTSREEIEQLDVRRGWLAALKGLDQGKWRCTSRPDKYAVAGLDDLYGRLGRQQLVSDPLERRSKATHCGLPPTRCHILTTALAAHPLIIIEREIPLPDIVDAYLDTSMDFEDSL